MGSCCGKTTGCSGGTTRKAKQFLPFGDDTDVVDVGMSYEEVSPQLVFPLAMCWDRHEGCTAQRKQNGEDVTITIKNDKDIVRVTYGSLVVPLPHVKESHLRDEAIEVAGATMRCKLVEYSFSFVTNIMHVWHLWYRIEAASPTGESQSENRGVALPVRILHKRHSSVRKDEITTWTLLETRVHTPGTESLPCYRYEEISNLATTAQSSSSSSPPPSPDKSPQRGSLSGKRVVFLSSAVPGWLVQSSARPTLCVEFSSNMDMSWDAFPVTKFSDSEYNVYLAHFTP